MWDVRCGSRETESALILDDPVRPELDINFRTESGKRIWILTKDGKDAAVCCIAFMDFVPRFLEEIRDHSHENGKIAVPYTLWSYTPGAGKKFIDLLLHASADSHDLVTFSPKSDIAFRFHTKNGAILISENLESDNYAYKYGGSNEFQKEIDASQSSMHLMYASPLDGK